MSDACTPKTVDLFYYINKTSWRENGKKYIHNGQLFVGSQIVFDSTYG